MITYTIGTQLRISAAFVDTTGAPVDPLDPEIWIRNPTGTIETFTYPANIVKDVVGSYHYDYLPTLVGAYYYAFKAVGVVTEDSFTVLASQL